MASGVDCQEEHVGVGVVVGVVFVVLDGPTIGMVDPNQKVFHSSTGRICFTMVEYISDGNL